MRSGGGGRPLNVIVRRQLQRDARTATGTPETILGRIRVHRAGVWRVACLGGILLLRLSP